MKFTSFICHLCGKAACRELDCWGISRGSCEECDNDPWINKPMKEIEQELEDLKLKVPQ